MAATQTYVTDMQTLNPIPVQTQAQVQGSQAVQSPSQASATVSQTNPTATIIQPSQAGSSGQQFSAASQSESASQAQTLIQSGQGSSGQQFIVTIAEPPGGGSGEQNQQIQDTVQLQQGTPAGQVIYQRQPQYVEGSPTSPNTDTTATVYAASNGQILATPAGQILYQHQPHYVYGEGSPPSPNETKPQVPVYTLSDGQMQNYSEYPQHTMYTPVSTYYQSSPGGHMTQLTQLGTMQGQLITHGGTYLVQGGAMDTEGHPLTHTTRASPVTEQSSTEQNQRGSHFDVKSWQREVQWLIDNYETAEGVSLPRSTLYNHYLRHCQEQKMDPMNPASFGKLIRSVFLGLRTRRLGTRGNSKYHYYGIRIKATSPLNQYTDDQTMAIRQQPIQGRRFKQGLSHTGTSETHDNSHYSGSENPHSQHQQYLGDASGALPCFEEIDMGDEVLPEGVNQEHLRAFEHLYKEHSEAILDIVVNLQFSVIEVLWQSFWRNTPGEDTNQTLENGETDEQHLPKQILYTICNLEPVKKYVRQSDYAFYQALVEVLIPDVLRPIPSSLTQAIRNFAKSLEGWLKGSMVGVPEDMIKIKAGAVSAFAQTLRRYTSLNHLAQAARAVLQNTTQINQMLTDLNRVDFANVQEQASWVCQCEDATVHQLEQDFKKTLQAQNSLEQWAGWLESVVQQVLKPHEGSPMFPKAARQFLLKWSFYSSMVIRDLTLRSAASFGSFHLIRLLYDEYMFYLVEHKVAAATGETPIAVMGEVRQFIDLGNVMSLGTMDTSPGASPKAQQLGSTVNAVTPSTTVTAVPAQTKIVTPGKMGLPAKTVTSAKVVTSAKPITLIATQPAKVLATSQVVGSNHVNASPAKQTFTTLSNAATGQHHVNSANTVTVVAAATGASPTPTKTIVVVPVSATGGGDAQPALKRLKSE